MSESKRASRDYINAFDYLWKIQIYLEKYSYGNYKARLHRKLANLYLQYGIGSQVLHHLELALEESKLLYQKDSVAIQQVNACYVALASKYRREGQFYKALSYLDSCRINDHLIKIKSYTIPIILSERGFTQSEIGLHKKGLQNLHQAELIGRQQGNEYLLTTYYFLGKVKQTLKEYDSAILFFEKSLRLSKGFKTKSAISAMNLKEMSKAYSALNQPHKAYELLYEANIIEGKLLEIQKATLSELFELKNRYQESIQRKDILLKEQNATIKKNEERQFKLVITLALIIIIVIVTLIVVRMRYQLRKATLQKKDAEIKNQLLRERNKEKVALKNRELTSYTLQIIDKDSAINELLEVINKEIPEMAKSMNMKFGKGSMDLWDEFNMRFLEVNSRFYEQLSEKHPSLSSTDHKHCALIKLKFSTKEMARILNIETHSVHISRSRIRKKMGLNREQGLEEYIDGI